MILSFILALFAVSNANASICDFYKNNNPDLYKLVCTNGSASSKPAGANSTFSAAFNLNSASLPTEPSSYGLETLVHRIRTGGDDSMAPTFSIVKGFRKFGTGISTGGNNTFYGDDLYQRLTGQSEVRNFSPIELQRGKLTNLNIGTSFELLSFQKGASLRIGLSGRYNKTTDSWGGGPALLANWTHFSLGLGYSREAVSNFLPRVTFVSFQASARYSIFELQYDQLTNNIDVGLEPIQILTATVTIKRLILTAATRSLNYVYVGQVHQNHYAVQFLFSSHLSGGLLYNFIPGATSLGVQYFL